MKSQWDCLLVHQGKWQGSSTHFSPQGDCLSDIPSLLEIERLDKAAQTVRLTLQRQGQADLVLTLPSGGSNLQFFETGAFSQSALQYVPYTEFAGELALVYQERRLRLVQMYDDNNHLSRVTLIREQRPHSQQPEQPPLTVAALLGDWQGEAVTLYPNLRSPERYPTYLRIRQSGDQLVQHLSFGSGINEQTIRSTATIMGNRLLFERKTSQIQILLLPDGASANCPVKIPIRQPFFLEAGWLMTPDRRQRLIRSFNSQGESVRLTLVTEDKVG